MRIAAVRRESDANFSSRRVTRFLQAQESKRLVERLDEVWRVTPESVKVRASCDPHRDRYPTHSVKLFVAHNQDCAIRSDSGQRRLNRPLPLGTTFYNLVTVCGDLDVQKP